MPLWVIRDIRAATSHVRLPPKADIRSATRHVRYGPIADMTACKHQGKRSLDRRRMAELSPVEQWLRWYRDRRLSFMIVKSFGRRK